MWGVASFFPTCVCGVSALVLKGLTRIRAWSLLDSEGASVGPLLLEHTRSRSRSSQRRSAQKKKKSLKPYGSIQRERQKLVSRIRNGTHTEVCANIHQHQSGIFNLCAFPPQVKKIDRDYRISYCPLARSADIALILMNVLIAALETLLCPFIKVRLLKFRGRGRRGRRGNFVTSREHCRPPRAICLNLKGKGRRFRQYPCVISLWSLFHVVG